MPVQNIICPICSEVFVDSDDIYSTSCGHVFHFSCICDWQSRATSCPQCRTHVPTTYKLYLNFDDTEESLRPTKELNIKLKSSLEKINQLNEYINCLHIQQQNLRQFEDGEINFLHLQGQFTESEEHNRQLRETVEVLTIENEYKEKEINLKIIEIQTLTTALKNLECQTSETYLNGKINILEHKLKDLMAEFQEELSNNTQLSNDKTKLNCYIDRMKLEEIMEEHGEIENTNIAIQNKNFTVVPISDWDSTSDVLHDVNVLIRNFPLNQISYPLDDIIIDLALIMNLVISSEDLENVSIMEKRTHNLNKVTLIVEFRSTYIKFKFLLNKNQLKKNPTYKSLTLNSCNSFSK